MLRSLAALQSRQLASQILLTSLHAPVLPILCSPTAVHSVKGIDLLATLSVLYEELKGVTSSQPANAYLLLCARDMRSCSRSYNSSAKQIAHALAGLSLLSLRPSPSTNKPFVSSHFSVAKAPRWFTPDSFFIEQHLCTVRAVAVNQHRQSCRRRRAGSLG